MSGDLLRLMREKQFALQPRSVDAIVTLPFETSITTRAIWVAPFTEDVPRGMDLRRAEVRRVLAIPKADVPVIPLKTKIEAPEHPGSAIQAWRVDGIDRIEPDHTRVVVISESA